MPALRAFVAVTVAAGLASGGLALAGMLGGPPLLWTTSIAALAVGTLLGELFPITIARRDGSEDLEVSHAFVLALILVAGPATAVLVQLVSIVLSSAVRRRAPLKAAFNIGQKLAAAALAGGCFAALAPVPALGVGSALSVSRLGSFLVAAAVFQVINEGSVAVVCALAERRPVFSFITADLHPMLFNAIVSLMAPLAAAGALASPWLLVVLIAPLWGVRHTGAVAIESRRQAREDALTGLPNAVALRELLEEALATRGVTVVMVDLDGFKEVNDAFGHRDGDALLAAVAARLRRLTADDGRVFRLQGDEFVLVVDEPDADAAMTRAAELVEAFHEPFLTGDVAVEVALSAGIATGTCSVDELLRQADVAMYEAKRERLSCARYDPRFDRDHPGRHRLVADLRRALSTGELEVHYQPQLSLRDGRVASIEALVRWRRNGELLYPDRFIEQVEHTGLITPLTLHVMRSALQECRRWTDDYGYDGRVGVNLSARTLHSPELAAEIGALLAATGMPAERLEVEITESALMSDPAGARRTLTALHELGVDILIDDFGTGYSSLAYLGSLPADGIKIDRSFVAGLHLDGPDAIIVRSTIDLGHNLGLRVVAEGVEDRLTCERLRALDADLAQGWLWCRAMPGEDVGAFLDGAIEVAA